jgi:hypothetical protein
VVVVCHVVHFNSAEGHGATSRPRGPTNHAVA